AELAVEHALAEGEVVAALVAEADGGGLRFQWRLVGPAPPLPALSREGRGDSCRALPAGAARRAGDVGEGVGTLRPLRAPQAFAAGHGRLFLDLRLGQLGEEARRDAAGPLAVDAAVGGVEDGRLAPRAGQRDVGETALLLEAGEAAFVHRPLRGEHALLPAGEVDDVELEPLGGVDGHDGD